MTTPTTAELLKYADLQMAAEAFLVDGVIPKSGDELKKALIRGNDHASKFTDTQAQDFVDHWVVVDQKANTATGFSGTLFRCTTDDPATGAKAGELVMSMRSTEFLDDAARDGQATNTLEIKEKGWAFGQIADMEAWFGALRNDPLLLEGKTFSVTGYSLGGHLATAFNLLRKEEADLQGIANPITSTYTFNGAGVGQVNAGTTLTAVIAAFRQARDLGSAGLFTKPVTQSLYSQLKTTINGQTSSATMDAQLGSVKLLRDNAMHATTVDVQLVTELGLLTDALSRTKSVLDEVIRINNGISSGGAGNPAQPISGALVDAAALDYQLAVLTAAKNTTPGPTLLNGQLPTAVSRPTNPWTISNFYDVYGATSLSAVSNSQYH